MCATSSSLQKLRGQLSALVQRLGKPSRLQRCTTLDRLQSGVAAVKQYGGSSKKYQAQKCRMIQPFHFRIESRISPVFIAG